MKIEKLIFVGPPPPSYSGACASDVTLLVDKLNEVIDKLQEVEQKLEERTILIAPAPPQRHFRDDYGYVYEVDDHGNPIWDHTPR